MKKRPRSLELWGLLLLSDFGGHLFAAPDAWYCFLFVSQADDVLLAAPAAGALEVEGGLYSRSEKPHGGLLVPVESRGAMRQRWWDGWPPA